MLPETINFKKLIPVLVLIFVLVTACNDNDVVIDSKEILTSHEWIQERQQTPNQDYPVDLRKHLYKFYEDGTYRRKEPLFESSGPDTVALLGSWSIDKDMIKLSATDTVFIDESYPVLSLEVYWRILSIEPNIIKVQKMLPGYNAHYYVETLTAK